MTKSRKQAPYSAEFRERAVRLVREHRSEYESQWAAAESIARQDRLHGSGAVELDE